MSLTVLFDLDDTLLENEIGVHLPVYLNSLQDHLSTLMPKDLILPNFLGAFQAMLGNDNIKEPLHDVFYEYFCRETGVGRTVLHPSTESYYRTTYPGLKSTTSVKPGAQSVVAEFDRRGYTMVIATNPFFPRAAVEQRLDWAELPVPRDRFRLLTTNEVFHFLKPNPAYYAETLGYLGWPEGPVVMIGNDLLNDVQAADKLGLATFLITRNGSGPENGFPGGAIEQAVDWIDAGSPDQFLPNYRSPEAILAIHKSTLAILDSYVRHCEEAAWNFRPGEEWTASEVLYHLMDVEEKVNLPRVQKLVSEVNPFIPGVDTDAWYSNGFPSIDPLSDMLARFRESRLETIRLLSGLSREEWQRPARHAIFGPTDLLEIAHIMARHDQLHARQLSQVLLIR